MLTKTALDIMKMRDIVKNTVSPKFIRYAKNGRNASDFAYHSPKAYAYSDKQVLNLIEHYANKAAKANNMTSPEEIRHFRNAYMEANKAVGSLHGKRKHINWGNASLKNMRQFNVHNGENPGLVKRTTNDLFAMHENAELLSAGKAMKVIKDKQLALPNFASHLHPDVVLQEHNMLSTLSGTTPKNIQAVRDNFKNLRAITGEKPILDNYIPGGYATGGRMNRRLRRHVYEKILKDYNPGYVPPKQVPTP